MHTKRILLIALIVRLSCGIVFAVNITNNAVNHIKKYGDYSMMRGTNGSYIYVNPSEFWNGYWKEDTNGWRVQLRIYSETNYWYPPKGGMCQISTNLMLRVEWGSVARNSGKYFLSPNGKYARFELMDVHGNAVPPNPDAGTNLLKRTLNSQAGLVSFPDIPRKLVYETNLPNWMSPSNGKLVAEFPKTISSGVYPHIEYGKLSGWAESDILGGIWSVTNRPPPVIGFLKLDEIYPITQEGDYTLTVQPVLYKCGNTKQTDLDRVDLPSVTTVVHLVPNVK